MDHSRNSLLKVGPSRPLLGSFVNTLLLAATLLFALTPACGAVDGNPAKTHQGSARTLASTISLADFGAAGDGVTDDGPALQSALDALADAGGGSLFVPDGRYAIITPVTVDFAGRAMSVTIQGTPSSATGGANGDLGAGLNLTAEFLIKTGVGRNAFALRNLTTLLVTDLVFIGDPTVADDAKIALSIIGIDDATLRRCEFYGLATFGPGGAIVYAEGSGLLIADSAFLGCAANSGASSSIVQTYSWKQITVTGTRFVDYGNRPDYYSKTTYQSPFSWVCVGGAAPLTNVSARRDVIIKDVFFDEGAYLALAVKPEVFAVPGGGAISLLYVSNLFVNVTNLGQVGLLIHSVDNVLIENSHFGWSHNARGAMEIAYVKNVLLNQIECVLSADTISADSTVEELSVINSVYATLNSQAPTTRVIATADPASGPARYVNQKYLEILGHPPDTPGYSYWSQQRARCSDDEQCTTDEALLSYLNSDPAATFSINGRVLDSDEQPLAAATVSLGGTHNVDTVTDADGRYTFAGLATSGEYTVTPTKALYSFSATAGTPGEASRSIITPGGDQTADFTATLATYSIKGRINDSVSGSGLVGVTIMLTRGDESFESRSQITTGSGDYSFENVPAGSEYTLTASKAFHTFAPAQPTLLLTGDIINLDFIGTVQTHSIHGWVSDGDHGLEDAMVTLSGDSSQVAVTDADGKYVLEEVAAGGNYVLTTSKRHYTFASQSVNNLVSDRSADFLGTIIRHAITGSVTVAGSALSGATITLTGDYSATTTTGSSGAFAFEVDAGGNYTVTAAKEGYLLDPTSASFADLDQNRSAGFDAALLPVLLTVANTNRAVAFNSLTMLPEPFALYTTPLDLTAEQPTQVILFARLNVAGPTTITAQAEDLQGNVYPLIVEFAGPLPGASGITQINLKLDDRLTTGTENLVSITVNGLTSAATTITIR